MVRVCDLECRVEDYSFASENRRLQFRRYSTRGQKVEDDSTRNLPELDYESTRNLPVIEPEIFLCISRLPNRPPAQKTTKYRDQVFFWIRVQETRLSAIMSRPSPDFRGGKCPVLFLGVQRVYSVLFLDPISFGRVSMINTLR